MNHKSKLSNIFKKKKNIKYDGDMPTCYFCHSQSKNQRENKKIQFICTFTQYLQRCDRLLDDCERPVIQMSTAVHSFKN